MEGDGETAGSFQGAGGAAGGDGEGWGGVCQSEEGNEQKHSSDKICMRVCRNVRREEGVKM